MAGTNEEPMFPSEIDSVNSVDEVTVQHMQLQSENEELRKRLAALEKTMLARPHPKKKYTSDDYDELLDQAIESAETGVPMTDLHRDEQDRPSSPDIQPGLQIIRQVFGRRKRAKRKPKVYLCSVCSLQFSAVGEYNEHVKIHETVPPVTTEAQNHDSLPYQGLADAATNENVENFGAEGGVAVKRFKCQHCDKTFGQSSALAIHVRKHNKGKKKGCHCPTCGKKFSDWAQVTRHMIKHTGCRPFKCSVCGRGFTQSGNMHRHERTHTGDTPYECKECGKKFTRSGKVNNHKCVPGLGPFKPRVSRPGPHICPICHREFSQPRLLDQHIPRHSSERPNICQQCGKSFASPEKLQQHLLCHYSTKPHQCPLCHKGFTKKSYLTEHMKIHVNRKVHRCEICWKTFSKKCYLGKHYRFIHKKNRPFKMYERPSEVELQKDLVASVPAGPNRYDLTGPTAPAQNPQMQVQVPANNNHHVQAMQLPQQIQMVSDGQSVQKSHSHQDFSKHVVLPGQLETVQLQQQPGFVQMIQNVQFVHQNQHFMIAQPQNFLQQHPHEQVQLIPAPTNHIHQPQDQYNQQQQQMVQQLAQQLPQFTGHQRMELHQTHDHIQVCTNEPTNNHLLVSNDQLPPVQIAPQPPAPILNPQAQQGATAEPGQPGEEENQHHHTRGQGPHQCDVCGKRYAQLYGLIKHKKKHQPVQETPKPVPVNHTCHICSRTFSDLLEYTRHLKQHREEAVAEAERVTNVPIQTTVQKPEQVQRTETLLPSIVMAPSSQQDILVHQSRAQNTTSVIHSNVSKSSTDPGKMHVVQSGVVQNVQQNPVPETATVANAIILTLDQARMLSREGLDVTSTQDLISKLNYLARSGVNVDASKTGENVQIEIQPQQQQHYSSQQSQRDFMISSGVLPPGATISSGMLPSGGVVGSNVPRTMSAVNAGHVVTTMSNGGLTTAASGIPVHFHQNL